MTLESNGAPSAAILPGVVTWGAGSEAFGEAPEQVPAAELKIAAVAELVSGTTPAYAWDPDDRERWAPAPRGLVRVVRRALPPPRIA